MHFDLWQSPANIQLTDFSLNFVANRPSPESNEYNSHQFLFRSPNIDSLLQILRSSMQVICYQISLYHWKIAEVHSLSKHAALPLSTIERIKTFKLSLFKQIQYKTTIPCDSKLNSEYYDLS